MDYSFDKFIPVISTDIELNSLSDNEYILSNIKHRHYLKINKEVYNLLQIIDGNKNLNELSNLYKIKYHKNIETTDIYNILINKLSKYGILKGFDNEIKKHEKPSYLKLSFIIINEKILSKFVRHFYFLFKKKNALIVVLSLTIYITTILITNFNLYKTFNLQSSLLYFFLIMASSVTFHEIGHVTSASYFGAKHGGIGGGFYLFTPVYFADVTDIWRLNKIQRIVVNLSGMYFELIFCSILATIALIIDNYLLLILSLTVCLKTLFNLNPFLRSDGYWVLSDLTDKPNLFYHSFKKVKSFFKFIFLKKQINWGVTDYIIFLYGLISITFICLFLFYVLINNPISIINLPINLYDFILSIFNQDTQFSLIKYGEIIVPLFFLFLVFNLIKPILKKKLGK